MILEKIERRLYPHPTTPHHHTAGIYISKANPFREDIRTYFGMLCNNLLLRHGRCVWGFTLLVLSSWQIESYLLSIIFTTNNKEQTQSQKILFILVWFIDMEQSPCLHVTVPICTYFIPCPHQMRGLPAWNNFWSTGLKLSKRGWEFKKVRSNWR